MDAKQITELIALSIRPVQRFIAIVLAMGVAFPAGILEKSQGSLVALSLKSEANLHTSPQSLEHAIDHQEQASELYTIQASLLPRLISLLLLTGEYETASLNTNKFDENASLDKDIARKEIKLLIAKGEFDAAIDQAKSLAQASSLESDLLSLASLYQRTEKLQEAQKIYDQLLSKQELSALVIVQAADFYASIAKAEKADVIIDLLSNDDISATTATLLGSYYLRHGNLELSEHWLRIAINKQPHLVDAWLALVQNYLSNDDPNRAYEAAIEGLKASPKSPELQSLFAVSVMQQDAHVVERAIEQLKEFAAPAENLLATLKLLKIIRQAGEETPLTSDHIEKAQELISEHGTFLPAWLLAITINERAGEFSNAAELARKASKRFPSSVEPSLRATNLLIETQRWDVALWQAQEWRNRSLNDPAPADKAAAKILLELGRYAEAVDRMRPYAKVIIAHGKDNPDHLSTWIRMLMLDGRVDEAYIIIKPLLDSASWLGFWLAQIQIIDPVDAESALRLTEVNLPSDDESVLKLSAAWADLASRTGESKMLLEAERITKNISDTISAQLVKGRIAVAHEDWIQAEAIYRKVIDQDQSNLTALYKLGFVICQTTNASSEALQFVERALVLAPEHPDILATYALVLMEFERSNDAQLALMHAHEKRPDDAGISLSLAETTLNIGKTNEAWQMLLDIERMLSIRPAIDPKLQNRADKLRQLINEAQAYVEVPIEQ